MTSSAEAANLVPKSRLSNGDTDVFIQRTRTRVQETVNFQTCWTRRLTWWLLGVDVLAGFGTKLTTSTWVGVGRMPPAR